MAKEFAQGAFAQDLYNRMTVNQKTFLLWQGQDIMKRILRKLNFIYLGVRTGQLRRTTSIVIHAGKSSAKLEDGTVKQFSAPESMMMYVGTMMPYGAYWETLNKRYFRSVKRINKKEGIKGSYKLARSYRQASMNGGSERVKRPFMKDSIKESEKALSRVIKKLARANKKLNRGVK